MSLIRRRSHVFIGRLPPDAGGVIPVSNTVQSPLEARGIASAGRTPPFEALQQLSPTFGSTIEALAGLDASRQEPIEALQGIDADKVAAIEAMALAASSRVVTIAALSSGLQGRTPGLEA